MSDIKRRGKKAALPAAGKNAPAAGKNAPAAGKNAPAAGTNGPAAGTNDRPAKSKAAESRTWDLRLYVAGETPRSRAAIENLRRICKEHLGDQSTLEVIDLRLAEELKRRAPELDADFGETFRHPLSRSYVKRHVRPPPVIDQQLQRGVRLCR